MSCSRRAPRPPANRRRCRPRARLPPARKHPPLGPQRAAGDGGREHGSPPPHEAAPEYMAVIAQATPGSAVLRFVIYPFLVIAARSEEHTSELQSLRHLV